MRKHTSTGKTFTMSQNYCWWKKADNLIGAVLLQVGLIISLCQEQTFVQARIQSASSHDPSSTFEQVLLFKSDHDDNHHRESSPAKHGHDNVWACKHLLARQASAACLFEPSAKRVCASDGRFYASNCDLELQSCFRNISLTAREDVQFCKQQVSSRLPSNRAEHRLIKLKAQCDLKEFSQFKQLLLNDFGSGQVRVLFEKLDSNKNNLIEARELWPRIQFDDEQSAAFDHETEINEAFGGEGGDFDDKNTRPKVAAGEDGETEDNYDDIQSIVEQTMGDIFGLAGRKQQSIMRKFSYAQLWHGVCPRNWVHCWRLLDFAFEPHFPQTNNPCSLSHLYLYAKLEHGSERAGLDLHSFERIFAIKKPLLADDPPDDDADDVIRNLRNASSPFELITLRLGDSLVLDCKPPNNQDQVVLSSGNPSPSSPPSFNGSPGDYYNSANFAAACWWSRYQANPLGYSLRGDLHVSINTSSTNSRLTIQDAQLYLSGPFKCHCKSTAAKKSSPTRMANSMGDQGGSSNVFGPPSQPFDEAAYSERLYMLQVIAEPRVELEPSGQFSMENSRANFECAYDFVDTRAAQFKAPQSPQGEGEEEAEEESSGRALAKGAGQFGASLSWAREETEGDNDHAGGPASNSESDTRRRSRLSMQSSKLTIEPISRNDSGKYSCQVRVPVSGERVNGDKTQFAVGRAESRLFVVIDAEQGASGTGAAGECGQQANSNSNANNEDEEDGEDDEDGDGQGKKRRHEQLNLWMFQDSGISVYRLRQDEGELELVRQIDGHSPISGQVDGNWNQLTLCGGLSAEQAVICEWSDNAIAIELPGESRLQSQSESQLNLQTANCKKNPSNGPDWKTSDSDSQNGTRLNLQKSLPEAGPKKQFVYVAQPNLNRIIVMDARAFEIVAIIQTEPQPRRLHLVKTKRPHLSKWIKRRLSPARLARLKARASGERGPRGPSQQDRARMNYGAAEFAREGMRHRRSRRRSRDEDGGEDGEGGGGGEQVEMDHQEKHKHEHEPDEFSAKTTTTTSRSSSPEITGPANLLNARRGRNDNKKKFVQFDIWLLCYGQPLVVDPSLGPVASAEQQTIGPQAFEEFKQQRSAVLRQASNGSIPSLSIINTTSGSITSNNNNRARRESGPGGESNHRRKVRVAATVPGNGRPAIGLNDWPFAWPPFLTGSPSLGRGGAGPMLPASDKESRLRNRKSVHIVQSTFFRQAPSKATRVEPASISHGDQQESNWAVNGLDPESPNYHTPTKTNNKTSNPVSEFRHSTLISTHHLSTMMPSPTLIANAPGPRPLPLVQDLIQDLEMTDTVRALEDNPKYKSHFAYISHYNERRLFRVSLDNYRYEREIDLQNCDPIQLTPTSLGLLIIQCRAPISHQLTGQLVLDELSSWPIEFNEQIKTQDAYLSPDHKYLISVYTNPSSPSSPSSPSNQSNNKNTLHSANNSTQNDDQQSQTTNSIIYLQTLTTSGAKFEYEIKTSTLEISECSFVWRDGYYVAIFVSTNKRDQESEILSLRLADGRLELMARVPGILGSHRNRHRNQLIVAPRNHLAALSTNQGVFMVDLQENRISQSIHQHQSPPTLLWV